MKALTLPRAQVYLSRHTCPFTNLSIEHHLLTRSHPDSTVLLLYTNTPCVVLGRNQNPWLETNVPLLGRINSTAARRRKGSDDAVPEGLQDISSVPVLRDAAALPVIRRRSGGGTVFHDLGNANYSVICPPAHFDRDKHAEMVVRALHKVGVASAHVNARHDICIARNAPRSSPPPARGEGSPDGLPPFKISGSAYKLTRLRSLHHGTCLLGSPNLPLAPRVLRSPAGVFSRARGVESVRSPIANAEVDANEWHEAVIQEFMDMYGQTDVQVLGEEGENLLKEDDVVKGKKELLSREWIYGQTPQFSFSTHPTESDQRARPALPFKGRLAFDARHGALTSLSWNGSSLPLGDSVPRIWEADAWARILAPIGSDASVVGAWLDETMGTAVE